jgi:dTDP-L-rhamnose 4-epimerase
VIAVDMLHPDVHPEAGRPQRLPPEVELIPMDVRSATAWDAVLKVVTPERIVHLSAETGTGQSLSSASRHGSTNVVGTTEMLDALARSGALPGHIVLASSRAVYGEGEWVSGDVSFYPGQRTHDLLAAGRWDPSGPDGSPTKPLPSRADRTIPRPTSVYGATKLAQEHVLTAWTGAMGVNLSTLRFQNVYGPGQSLTNSYTGIVTLFARLASAGETLPVYEDGQIIRDFVFIDDVVAALTAVLERAPVGTEPIDIGSGDSRTILEVACLIATLRGAPEPKVTGQFRDGDVRAASTDTSPARERLGYESAWPLHAGLAELFSWIDDRGPSTAVDTGSSS